MNTNLINRLIVENGKLEEVDEVLDTNEDMLRRPRDSNRDGRRSAYTGLWISSK
jgi:hypothetical protein